MIQKQEIRVHFVPGTQTIHIDADYRLMNAGTLPIRDIQLLLPVGRRLQRGTTSITWDGSAIAAQSVPDHPRNSTLHFAESWTLAATHTLHVAYDLAATETSAGAPAIASDAFYLPAAGWGPELPQVPGLFGFGGVPPKKWDLVVTVPEGFLVHSSGDVKKTSRQSTGEQTLRTQQTIADRYPFVVAGRYNANEIRGPQQKIILWSRSSPDAAVLQQASSQLARTINLYNSIFGAPASRVPAFWIVECPVPATCIANLPPNVAALLDENAQEAGSAELVSSDTVMVDPSNGAPQLAAAAAPSLASSWLGYGRNPGFYVQSPPLALLPIFAAARSHEVTIGPQTRSDTIRRALRLVPKNPAPRQPRAPVDDPQVERVKSFLFFYALQDRYGHENFDKAISHMLNARAARGFDLDDLIAALEQETHQNVAQFVRLWMKHPGVPEEFRARYETTATNQSPPNQAPLLPSPTLASASQIKGDTP